MKNENKGKIHSWHIVIIVIAGLFSFGKFGFKLYQEYVVEPKQNKTDQNNLMNFAYQLQQLRYKNMDQSLKNINENISNDSRTAEEDFYVESFVRNGNDIVITTVSKLPLDEQYLNEIKTNFDQVKNDAIQENLPDFCEQGSFFSPVS